MIILVLPWPPSTNHLYATVNGRRVLSKAGNAYHATVVRYWQQRLATDKQGFTPLSGRLSVHMEFTAPSQRMQRYDLDGRVKCLLDALGAKHAGVYVDDKQIDQLHLYRRSAYPPGEVAIEILEVY